MKVLITSALATLVGLVALISQLQTAKAQVSASDLAGESTAIQAHQVAANKNGCINSHQKKFNVKCKDRYFFGETPAIDILITNITRSPQTVKEAEHQKFSFEMTGLFQNDSGQYRKTSSYDGSWEIPKEPTRAPLPGEFHEWTPLRKRDPKYIKLLPGESTTLELDLSKTFGSYLGVSKYKLTVKSEDGQKVVKEFEVYFDSEKSAAYLDNYLKGDDGGRRTWALFTLMEFNRPNFIALLKEQITSGDEKQRGFATGVLRRLKAGDFDPLKLRVENKERYFLGEHPIIAISIKSNHSKVQMVEEARCQKFSVELVGVFGNDSRQETKKCLCDGGGSPLEKQEVGALRAGRTPGQNQPKPKLVKLGELEATTFSLDLFQCNHSHLAVGKYQLIVKSADKQGILKDQEVVKEFEVYFDDQQSPPVLAQLKSDDLKAAASPAPESRARSRHTSLHQRASIEFVRPYLTNRLFENTPRCY